MPGRCLCAGEQSPLPVVEELPGDPAFLKWLAYESAYMLSADGTRCPCVRAELRQQALKHGFCRGSLLSHGDIATALEKRFGLDTLNWLGYPPWTDGRPSVWICRVLHSMEQKRTPTIVFLLFLGLFNSSVGAFEAATTDGDERLMLGKLAAVSDWRANLYGLLASHSFRLTSVARRIGVSRQTVAAEARKQGIRMPVCLRLGLGFAITPTQLCAAGFSMMRCSCAARRSPDATASIPSTSPILSASHRSSGIGFCGHSRFHAGMRSEFHSINAWHVAAIELMAAAQAFDLRAPVKPSPPSEAAYQVIRSHVKRLDEDRPLFDDINTLTRVAKNGKILEAAEKTIGRLH
jgi:hypothetical protein